MSEHITKPLIYLGLENGFINIVSLKSIYDDGSDGLVCRIGEYWFFFDGEKADNAKSITSYFVQTPIFMLVDNIYNSLEDISKIKENETEYKYYYWYLIEKLRCMEEDE